MANLRVTRLCFLVLMQCAVAAAQTASITVSVDRPGKKVSPLLYGIFFEEINRAGDGGLYAEMVQNRSFEDADELAAWEVPGEPGSVAIDKSEPLNEQNPRSLRVNAAAPVRLINRGFKGMALRAGAEYVASFYARGDSLPVTLKLAAKNGSTLASHAFDGIGDQWKRFECTLKPSADEVEAQLVLEIGPGGGINLDMVSLIPKQTWKDSGLRSDLAEMLEELKPAFVRFPGGCWVEGETLETAYRWKQTIGDVTQRRNQYNLWKYHSTHGLGFHEYLQLSENLGAEPLFVINCGMAHNQVVPMDEMGPWVQDALDAIEYANGPPDSKWGAERARNGHPKPFGLKFLQIGNENGGTEYDQRYALFYDAIKKRYPQMNVIANLWYGKPSSRPIEILDEHYYNNPAFFIANADRYDTYDRKGPAIYCGEYACTSGVGTGNLAGAVGEAAFMAGMERNSDVVTMSSYAPLFCNVHYKGWNPNAINFDASRVYGTPSYYVQQMFSRNRADVLLPIEVKLPDEAPVTRRGAAGVGAWATQAEFKDVRVTRGEETLFTSGQLKDLAGWNMHEGQWGVSDGGIRQSGDVQGAFAVAGDPTWSDYTLSLKARKLGGREGFLIPFHWLGKDDYTMWNLGGWNNVQHQIEHSVGGTKMPLGDGVGAKIETGRWYDIRIETHGNRVRCYLDNKLIHDVHYPRNRPLHAVAGRAGDEVIVKIVNVTDRARETEISFAGASGIAAVAKLIELTSQRLEDENSLEEPRKVAPVEREARVADSRLRHTFPAHSVTVIRAADK